MHKAAHLAAYALSHIQSQAEAIDELRADFEEEHDEQSSAPATINLFGLLHRCGTCTVSSRRSIDVQASAMLVWKSAGGSSPPTVHHIRFATVVGHPTMIRLTRHAYFRQIPSQS